MTAALSPAQQSHLRATLARVDELLADAVRTLDTARGKTPLARYAADATPAQHQIVADYAERARVRMAGALEALRVPTTAPTTGAVHAARTTLLLAQIALEGIEPAAMRGYGALDDGTARALSDASADLLDVLRQIDGHLARSPAAPAETRAGERSASAGILHEVERAVTEHGLVELQGMLTVLADRFRSPLLEVAFFARTNAGKSSLLNCLLGSPVLPVGALPVTAVPVRLVHGTKPWGRTWFVDAIPESFPLGRLAEFVDGHYNPSNARHVVRLTVELPARLLEGGVSVSDTPGIGSLIPESDAEALAYLPRCDLGVVLVDASSGLSSHETALVDALRGAGAAVMDLLSKADLLSPDDRLRVLGHLRRELERRTGAYLAVHAVSVKGADAALADAWRDEVLQPWLRAHGQTVDRLLHRKLRLLLDATIDALERRGARLAGAPAADASSRRKRDEALARALAALEKAGRDRSSILGEPREAGGKVLDEAAHNIAVLWSRGRAREVDASELLAASLSGACRAAAGALLREITRLRAGLAAALDEAREDARPSLAGELPQPCDLPSLPGIVPTGRSALPRPKLAAGLWLLRRVALRRLRREGLALQVELRLAEYEARLQEWRATTVQELQRTFAAERNLVLAGLQQGSAVIEADALQAKIEHLKALAAARGEDERPRGAWLVNPAV